MMDTESELIQKKLEVKPEILALREQIPSARIFNWLGRPFRHNSLGYWLANVVLLHLILLMPGILIELVFEDIDIFLRALVPTTLGTEMVILGFIAGHFATRAGLDDIAMQIVDHNKSTDDLSKLLEWLTQTWSAKHVLTVAIPFCLLWVLLAIGSWSFYLHRFVGFGLCLWYVTTGLLAGIVLYILLWFSLLAFNLRNYRYEMNAISPADSEVIYDISHLLNRSIYVVSGVAAVITLLSTSSLVPQQIRSAFSLPLLAIAWAVITSQFLLTRSTLGTIINRAKWIALNRIRSKINAIEATGDLSDKDTTERLFRLTDVHKQIMASKSNTLDLKSISTLFSQLMLPLLGLLLGNLDKLSKLLP
jgi:hypothetical protein